VGHHRLGLHPPGVTQGHMNGLVNGRLEGVSVVHLAQALGCLQFR
jgi:hypothetical protein